MPYTLDSFTRQVPPALLMLARAHVSLGQVQNLEHVDIEWLADVAPAADEKESHAVSVAIGPRGELLATCSCDDEQNDLCRHAVATLLAAVKQEPAAAAATQLAAKSKKHATARKPAKTSTIGRLRTALEAAPHDTLVDLLLEVTKGDKHLQNLIYLRVVDVGASMDAYATALSLALSPRGGVNAWYDARSSRAAAKQISMLLALAETTGNEGDADKAARMALKVHEETMALLARIDFCEPIENCAFRAINIVQAYVGKVSPSVRNEIFDSLVRTVQASPRSTEKAILDLKGLLVEMVASPAERALLQPLLKPPAVTRSYFAVSEEWDISVNAHYLLQYALIERLDGVGAAEAFAAENSRFLRMRRILIDHANERGDLKSVDRLAREGLQMSDKAKMSSVSAYYRAQLIAIAPAIGANLSELLLSELLAQQSNENFLRYKQSVPEREWPKARARLLKRVKAQPDFSYFIYHMEEMWPELMEFLKSRTVTVDYVHETLQLSGAQLAAAVPDDLAYWCAQTIDLVEKKKTTTRPQFHSIAVILMDMHKLGLNKQAAAIAERLRIKYAGQPVLVAELSGL